MTACRRRRRALLRRRMPLQPGRVAVAGWPPAVSGRTRWPRPRQARRRRSRPAARYPDAIRRAAPPRAVPTAADQIAELVDAGVQPGLTHHLRGSLDGLNVG